MIEGCASTISLEGNPEQVLERLQAACAPNSVALKPEPAHGNGRFQAHLTLDDPSACVRVAAFSPEGGANPTLTVKDSSGQIVGEDTLAGPIALVDKEGPVCLRKGGELELSVGASAANASVFVGAWRAR